jgi:hypothetical protein
MLLLLALGLAGCELVAYADRDLIPSSTGGGGAGGGGAGGSTGGGTTTSTTSSTSSGTVACILPADCPGSDTDCTVRTCDAGVCGTANVAKDTPTSNQIAGDCKRAVCDGSGKEILVDDDQDVPVDGNPCTDDTCTAGVPSNPASGAGAPCTVNGGKVCDGAGTCVACTSQADCDSGLKCVNNACVTCFDLKKDGTETDVDCGGPSCAPCDPGKNCATPSDCTSGVCSGFPKTCQAPACSDMVQNGAETDVDCGGGCPGCGPGMHCNADADCAGHACVGGACAPNCSDGVKDNDETDKDCGGSCAAKCADGKGCAVAADCTSDVCGMTGVCLMATCADGVINEGETDKDCGGPCSPCADGSHCVKAADCTSGVCTSGTCAMPTCGDMVQNGSETDKDCGGGTCPACALGAHCAQHADCASGVCTGGVCVSPSCSDKLQNEGESDVDCGGPCPPCAAGSKCVQGSDCTSTVCTGGVCTTPTCTDMLKNGKETGVDCGGPDCSPCPLGEGCVGPLDCQSVACNGLVCVQPTCSDNTKNGGETGVDCGGGTCPPCGAGQGCAMDADCAAPNTCGGGNPGTANVCGCTADPLATSCAGATCGTVTNNCGATVSCGSCAAPLTCGGGGTPGACGCPLAGGCLLNTLLAKRFGGLDDDDGFAVAVRGSGVLLGGATITSIDFGGGTMTSNGSDDAYGAKLDLTGAQVWAKHYGDTNGQLTRAVALDASGNAFLGVELSGSADFGGGALTSAGSTDIAIVKLDASGNYVWAKQFGDSNAQAVRGIGTDANGNVYFAGAYVGSVDFGGGPLTSAGNADVFIAKLSPAGGYVWAKLFGDTNSQTANALAADASGNTAMTGQIFGTVNFGGGNLVTAGAGDVYVAAFDATGALRWAKAWGDSAAQTGNGVAIDASGNVILGGAFKGNLNLGGTTLVNPGGTTTNDAFVAKFDAMGNHLWSKRFGDSTDQSVNAVAVDASGNVLATGSFNGTIDCGTGPITSAGASDVFVVKYSPSGTCLQARRYGNNDTGAQTGRGIAADASGNVWVYGDFTGTLDVDIGSLTSADAKLDAFLLKLSP